MLPDTDKGADIIREVAAEKIVPRFRALTDGEISEKKPGDLVTVADIEAERALCRALGDLVPGATLIGEEQAEDTPHVIDALAGTGPVWVVDPVDGTVNFVRGNPCFAVILAYCEGGKTRAGWIYDPLSRSMVSTVAGEGAWEDGRRLRTARGRPLAEMAGSLGSGLRKDLARRRKAGEKGLPRKISRYGCVGREYMDLARGRLHFARYANRLKPWDHAAGVLIHEESGGFSGLLDDAGVYAPKTGIVFGTLLLAPDEMNWQSLRNLLAN